MDEGGDSKESREKTGWPVVTVSGTFEPAEDSRTGKGGLGSA